MRGKVEVFSIASDGSQRLLLSEPNLIVDGAGQSIVDMLTCPSSVLTLSPNVVDASNWRWGALSFGPAASSFHENAYFFPEVIPIPAGDVGRPTRVYYKRGDACAGVSADVTPFIDQICKDKIMRVLWVSSVIGEDNGATASSYTPPYQLPSYPDPQDQKLEDASTSYSLVSGDGTQSYGHFENRIMYASGDASSYFQGAYPVSGNAASVAWNTSALLVDSYEGDYETNPSLNIVASGPAWPVIVGGTGNPVVGLYNYYRAIDYRGFIETKYNINGGVIAGLAAVSGVVNSSDGADLILDPRVVVSTYISPGDLWSLDMYGGIHNIGLWSIDCQKSLIKGGYPPFMIANSVDPSGYVDESGVTKREFRLFAKKTFTENLTQVRDKSGYSGFAYRTDLSPVDIAEYLLFTWTIDFRSQHD